MILIFLNDLLLMISTNTLCKNIKKLKISQIYVMEIVQYSFV